MFSKKLMDLKKSQKPANIAINKKTVPIVFHSDLMIKKQAQFHKCEVNQYNGDYPCKDDH
jgi:hypothetical protein